VRIAHTGWSIVVRVGARGAGTRESRDVQSASRRREREGRPHHERNTGEDAVFKTLGFVMKAPRVIIPDFVSDTDYGGSASTSTLVGMHERAAGRLRAHRVRLASSSLGSASWCPS
jgi:hypothetical protein